MRLLSVLLWENVTNSNSLVPGVVVNIREISPATGMIMPWSPMSDTDAIAVFWSWFAANEERLRRAYDCGDTDCLDVLLSPPLRDLAPDLGWEIGPYALPEYSFVLSPGGRKLVELTRRIVELAPRVPGWRVFAGKPPKDLLSLTFERGDVEVCADNWRYRLTSQNRGEFVDIEVFFEKADAPPDGEESFLCELVLEALVGELVSLERIGDVTHKCVADVSAVERATPMRHLKEHLCGVLAPSP